jgi:hypothetical protein
MREKNEAGLPPTEEQEPSHYDTSTCCGRRVDNDELAVAGAKKLFVDSKQECSVPLPVWPIITDLIQPTISNTHNRFPSPCSGLCRGSSPRTCRIKTSSNNSSSSNSSSNSKAASSQLISPLHLPQNGQDFTLSSVLHFLQTEWRKYERDRNEWEIERAEMRVRPFYFLAHVALCSL